MKSINISIDSDTTVWTATAGFAGYTLEDAMLGDQPPEAMLEGCSDSEALANTFIEWLDNAIFRREGFFLSEEECEESLEEESRVPRTTPESFTVRKFAENFWSKYVPAPGSITQVSELGSAAVSHRFPPDTQIRFVADNNKPGDARVTLYQAYHGEFFATTNADPIFEPELEENCPAEMLFSDWVQTL